LIGFLVADVTGFRVGRSAIGSSISRSNSFLANFQILTAVDSVGLTQPLPILLM